MSRITTVLNVKEERRQHQTQEVVWPLRTVFADWFPPEMLSGTLALSYDTKAQTTAKCFPDVCLCDSALSKRVEKKKKRKGVQWYAFMQAIESRMLKQSVERSTEPPSASTC